MNFLNCVFKTFILIIFFSIAILEVQGSNYYFSVSKGDDTRSLQQAQNPATPWKSINKLNVIFPELKAGDVIFFNRGEVFEGSVIAKQSGNPANPISFSAYGIGAKPIISGFATLQNWTSRGNGIWEAACIAEGNGVNMVTFNDKVYAMGRYPNATDANKGYLTITSHKGKTQLTGRGLSGNWLGGEVVIRMNRWIIDRNLITSQNGNSLTFTSTSDYIPEDNYGFFIQNHPNTLDTFGEWYYDKVKQKLSVFFGSVNPNTYVVKASVRETGISLKGKSFFRIENLSIQGANNRGLDVESSTGVQVSNCDILFSGADAVYGISTKAFTLQSSTISSSNNNAVSFKWMCANIAIRDNKISSTGLLPGMGQSGDFTYQGVTVIGNKHVIECNEITKIGYNPIRFGGGNDNVVKNNFIKDYNLVKDDGAGIYTWSDGKVYTGHKVIGNIVLNGQGAPAGTANPEFALAEGIYLDDNSANIEVAHNTVSNATKGLYVHNAHDLSIHDNTFFNNREHQVYMEHDKIAANSPIRRIKFFKNILAAKQPAQQLLSLRTKDNDIAQFGAFDNNYYTRTLGGNAVTVSTATGNYMGFQVSSEFNLAKWKTIYGFDINSRENNAVADNKPTRYYRVKTLNVNKFPNNTFEKDINGLFTYAKANNLVIMRDIKLDGGALKASFTSITGNPEMAYVAADVIDLKAGKKYLLRFSSLGEKANRTLKVRIVNNEAPYQTITLNSFFATTSRQEHEFLLEPSVSINKGLLRFELSETDGTLWLDNVALYEADLVVDNEHVRFEYNPSASAKTVSLGGITYIDAKNTVRKGSIILAPYASVVLMKQASTVSVEKSSAVRSK